MKTFQEFLSEKQYYFDVFQKKQSGLVKLDSLNQDELDDWMMKSYGKYSTVVVKRSDGQTITYDDDGQKWKVVSRK